MRKFLSLSMLLTISMQFLAAGDGGAAVGGMLGGLALGTIMTSAASQNSGKAQRAEDKAEQLRIDQERERVRNLEREFERREVERKFSEHNTGSSLFMILMALVVVLAFGVIGLSILILRKKP
jgi:cobalamin biosynthesis Mg chelatase CobN